MPTLSGRVTGRGLIDGASTLELDNGITKVNAILLQYWGPVCEPKP